MARKLEDYSRDRPIVMGSRTEKERRERLKNQSDAASGDAETLARQSENLRASCGATLQLLGAAYYNLGRAEEMSKMGGLPRPRNFSNAKKGIDDADAIFRASCLVK